MAPKHEDCDLRELFQQKIITVEDKLDSMKENIELKLHGMRAEMNAGNELIMLKLQEMIDLKPKIEKVEKDAQFSAWVGKYPKLAIIILVLVIIGVYALIDAGLFIKLIKTI